MIKLTKSVDEKLYDIGFIKVREDKHGCEYERKDKKFGYTHKVVIGYKESGRHILQSYDPALIDNKLIGNTCVGLTGYEMKLFIKKMKKIGLYKKKRMEK